MKWKNRLLSLLACLTLCLTLLPVSALAVENVAYLEYVSGTSEEKNKNDVTEVKNTDTEWGATDGQEHWYVAQSSITINARVTVTGNVHLILSDNCTLTAVQGIKVEGDNSLTIYAQSEGDDMGKLITNGGNDSTGIGGNASGNIGGKGGSSGTVTIHGGVVTASSTYGAGIGGGAGGYNGGKGGNGGAVTIHGGVVTASSTYGAGIGGAGNSGTFGSPGGNGGDGGMVTVYGGTVTASSTYGAGIGGGIGGNSMMSYDTGGNGGCGAAVNIYGGTVAATGYTGIGSGSAGTGSAGNGSPGGAGSLTLSDNGWVSASSVQPTPTVTSGVLFNGNNGSMSGSVTLPVNAEVSSGKTLTIPNGQVLTVPDGVILTNNGTLSLTGGTLEVYGTLGGSGTLSGSGTVERSISAPTAKAVTDTSVTLNAVSSPIGGGAVTYGYAETDTAPASTDTVWQSGTTFTGLDPNKTYYFFARATKVTGDITYNETVSSGKEIKTNTAPSTGTASLTVNRIDFGTVTTGYTQPDAVPVTVTNTGAAAATVTGVAISNSTAFALSVVTALDGSVSIPVLVGETVEVAAIQPIEALSIGAYSTTVTVTYDSGTITAPVSIAVAPAYGYGDSDDDDDTNSYTLTFRTNGGSSLPSLTRTEGARIDLSRYTPARTGYTFAGWYADEALTEPVTDLTLRWDTTVYAKWCFLNPFTDVKTGDFCYEGALWAVENGITLGTTASTFSPDEVCTRAQIITMLWRAKGSPEPGGHPSPFSDVGENEEDEYYYKAVLWAWQNGIAGGYGNNMFGPDEPCTRAEALTFLWRVMGSPRPAANAPFTDLEPRAYYTYAVGWGYENGIVNGTGNGLFDPGGVCTRGQIVTMMWRAMG